MLFFAEYFSRQFVDLVAVDSLTNVYVAYMYFFYKLQLRSTEHCFLFELLVRIQAREKICWHFVLIFFSEIWHGFYIHGF